jgi:hypothetical protein
MDMPCGACGGFTVPSLLKAHDVSGRYAALVEAHLTRGELLVQRDRARDIAAALEAEVAAVAALHAAHPSLDLSIAYCIECDEYWPCSTARAIGMGGDDDADE